MWVVQTLSTPPDGDLNGKKDDKPWDTEVSHLNSKGINFNEASQSEDGI